MTIDEPIHVAQRTFRALLSAMAHPGRVTPIDEFVDAPAEFGAALGAGMLALLDPDVGVWIAPDAPPQLRAWLVTQTGCRLVSAPGAADFVVLLDPRDALPLQRWNAGTAEDPELSATLLVRVDALSGGPAVTLTGPGIEHAATVMLRELPPRFWSEWQANTARYPIGVDCLFFDTRNVIGLPRTAVERSV